MPRFIYACDKGHEFEEIQTIHEEPLTACTANVDCDHFCDAPVRRVFGTPHFTFKGGSPTPKFYRSK